MLLNKATVRYPKITQLLTDLTTQAATMAKMHQHKETKINNINEYTQAVHTVKVCKQKQLHSLSIANTIKHILLCQLIANTQKSDSVHQLEQFSFEK